MSEQLGTCLYGAGTCFIKHAPHTETKECYNWQPVPAPAEPAKQRGVCDRCPTYEHELNDHSVGVCIDFVSAPVVAAPAEGKRGTAEWLKQFETQPELLVADGILKDYGSDTLDSVPFVYNRRYTANRIYRFAQQVLAHNRLDVAHRPAEPVEYTCPRCGSNVSTHICMGEPATENAGKVQATGTHWCLTCGITALGCGHELANRQDDSASAEPVAGETKYAPLDTKACFNTAAHFEHSWDYRNKTFRCLGKSIAPSVAGETKQCTIPSDGWTCSRKKGHEGPCAARPLTTTECDEGLSKEIGEELGFEVKRWDGDVLIRDSDSTEWTSAVAWARSAPQTVAVMLSDAFTSFVQCRARIVRGATPLPAPSVAAPEGEAKRLPITAERVANCIDEEISELLAECGLKRKPGARRSVKTVIINMINQVVADDRAMRTPSRARKLATQMICKHAQTRGGNDYISCDDCGLEWDYTKQNPVIAIEVHNPGLFTHDSPSGTANKQSGAPLQIEAAPSVAVPEGEARCTTCGEAITSGFADGIGEYWWHIKSKLAFCDLEGKRSWDRTAWPDTYDPPATLATPSTNPVSTDKWRVGRKLGRTLYIGDRFIGSVDSRELASQIVEAVNAGGVSTAGMTNGWTYLPTKFPPKRGEYLVTVRNRVEMWIYIPSDPLNVNRWDKEVTAWQKFPAAAHVLAEKGR